MSDTQPKPDDPLAFIKDCVRRQRLLWTYHVNMRLISRSITREVVLAGVEAYEVIEEYPDDKYLPSYLVLVLGENEALHILFAADVVEDNVRVVTAYRPDPAEWESDLKKRKTP